MGYFRRAKQDTVTEVLNKSLSQKYWTSHCHRST